MRKQFVVLVIVLAVLTLASCAILQRKRSVPVNPFEPLPITAYEGVGVSTDPDIRIAMDQAYVQAMGNLATNIFAVVSAEITDIAQSEELRKPLLAALREIVVTVPLSGKKFREERRNPKTKEHWCRVYMAKSEVDKYVLPEVIAMSKNLLESIESKVRERITKANLEIERDLQILNSFHRKQIESLRN